MNKKLKLMTEKASFSAYRLTPNGGLEILGRNSKIVENYFSGRWQLLIVFSGD